MEDVSPHRWVRHIATRRTMLSPASLISDLWVKLHVRRLCRNMDVWGPGEGYLVTSTATDLHSLRVHPVLDVSYGLIHTQQDRLVEIRTGGGAFGSFTAHAEEKEESKQRHSPTITSVT